MSSNFSKLTFETYITSYNNMYTNLYTCIRFSILGV